jgi:hypothetical protein
MPQIQIQTKPLRVYRSVVSAFLVVTCVVLSFRGFPWAMVSLLGSLIVMTGYTGAVSAILRANTPAGAKPFKRFLFICLGFAVASVGASLIPAGGLVSITVAGVTLDLKLLGVVGGILSAILQLDDAFIT